MNMQLRSPASSAVPRHQLTPAALTKGAAIAYGDPMRPWLTLSIVILAMVVARAAQSDVATPAARPSSDLAEIVVTAEKRESTVQATPISITAITGDQLQAQGISGIGGIVAAVPGISMRTSGPGQTELEMRGLASSGGAAPTVGFYLDEVPLTPPPFTPLGKVVIDPDLFDLNRVEVLRGPQGTLYGAGSMGGTIKLVTNGPNLEKVEGDVDTTLSGTQGGGVNPGVNAMFNVPLIDNMLALRLVVTDKYTSGWIDRDVVANFPFPINPCPAWGAGCTRGNVLASPVTQKNNNVNWENLQGGRASLLFRPNDNLSIDTLAMYQRIRMGGYSDYDQPPGSGTEAHYQPYSINEPFADTFSLAGVAINYDFDFARLTSATSYWRRSEKQTQDATEAIESYFATIFGFQQFAPNAFTEEDDSRQFSQEFRMASSGPSRFQWLGGIYYSKLRQIYEDYNGTPLLADFSAGGASANPNGIIFESYDPYYETQYAVFGEGSYKLTDTWKATIGARYSHFANDLALAQSGILTLSGNAVRTFSSSSSSSSGVTPKFNIAYEPNADLTVYASASKGLRPGASNGPIPANLGCAITSESYSPDSIWDYEMGEKARLMDRRLSVNADFFYIKWSNVQQLITQSCGFGLNANAGNARSYGPELEITAQLNDNLLLSIAATYTNAKIVQVNPVIAAADPTLVDGFPILNIPKYTETTTLSYKTPLSPSYDFTALLSNSYVGTSTDVSFAYEKLPSYDILRLRLGAAGKSWQEYFFVDNLTDTKAELSINTTSFSWIIPSLTRVATNQPRTIGVEVNYRY
jgi:iron complex outermembrane receptor protein